MGHPALSNGYPALQSLPTSEPFLGFSSLGASMTSQVNQQRLASSAATQPRLPQLPSRGRRRQGPATRPPQLPRALRLEDCISNITGEPLVQLVVKVYPPQVSALNKVRNGALIYDIIYFSELLAQTCSITGISATPLQRGWKKSISIIP